MEKIIRSNAVETSSQSESLRSSLQKVHHCYDIASKMASIYGGTITSQIATLPEPSRNTLTSKATTSQVAITNINNCSTSLQKLLEKRPSVVARLILFSGLAFFTSAVSWACTGKIEEISHVQGKFVSSEEIQQLKQIQTLQHHTNLTVVNDAAMSVAKEQTATSIVSSPTPLAARQQLLTQLPTRVNQLQAQIADAKTLPNHAQVKLKPQSLHAPKVGELEKTITEISSSHASPILVATLPYEKASFVKKGDKAQIKVNTDSHGNNSILFGTVVSIGDVQPHEKLGWVYRVKVAVNRNQSINLKAGQTAAAEIIHHRRIADMFLEPIKDLQTSGSNL